MAHIPVLLQEVLSILDPKPGEFFIDGTLGPGGHGVEVLERIQPGGIFLGVDRDPLAISEFKNKITGTYYAVEKTLVRHSSYSNLPEIIQAEDLPRADGLLLDLGFSSEQVAGGQLANRGFSFSTDEPLLMTYNPDDRPLRDVLLEIQEDDLAEIISKYSQERYASQIAKEISGRAKKGLIQTTLDLSSAVERAVPKNYENGRINPATRTFMALRIYINQELEHLETFLKNLEKIIKPNGRIAVISFHSEEDRIVKNYFRDYSHQGKAELLTKKPITATDKEISENTRSRSAKLRAIKII